MAADKPSTWYEDTRREILYTCEERYDGSMVAFVMDLQRQLEEKQAALDALRRKVLKDKTVYVCRYCGHEQVPVDEKPCDGCSHNPAHPLQGIGTDRFNWMKEGSENHDAG